MRTASLSNIRKTYFEITLRADETGRDLLIPPLLALGCHGFLETDTGLIAYAAADAIPGGRIGMLRRQIEMILADLSHGTLTGIREIPEENWNLAWEKSVEPVEIGEQIVIKPSWKEYRGGGNKIVLEIDPKMSFGTGHHETTRLCLELLVKSMRSAVRVLDVGTGTGILAIAAVKLGALSAVAIDTDEWSIENAVENATANGVDDRVAIVRASLEEFKGERFDTILANLTLNMIIDSLPHFRALLRDGGTLILSGFLEGDVPILGQSLREARFEIASVVTENGWSALTVSKLPAML